MKSFLITVLILSGIVYGLVHSYKMPPTTEVVFLRDVTDKYQAQPDVAGILSQFQLSKNEKWNGAKFRYSEISDVSYNQIREAEIQPGNKWLSNEQDRDRKVKVFESNLSKIITEAQSDSIGRNYSSIYLPMAMELNRLSQSQSQKRILIVYSDLMEHDLDISLYAKDQLRLMQSHPEKLNATLNKKQYLKDLTGIEVYIIYQPSDAMYDKDFVIVTDFYKSLIEEMGAKVMVRANL